MHLLNPGSAVVQLDNVLLSGNEPQLVKLCDFGYSKDGALESSCKTTCGTPEYMAPEVSRTHPPPTTRHPCDIYISTCI